MMCGLVHNEEADTVNMHRCMSPHAQGTTLGSRAVRIEPWNVVLTTQENGFMFHATRAGPSAKESNSLNL